VVAELVRHAARHGQPARGVVPEKASRPFSKDRDGFVMAEGAGAIVLEDYGSARARGANVVGFVLGCGEKADDYHRTRSKPDGTAIIGAVRNALADAGIAPDEISYVNAHGTSTPENDKMEYLSLKAVLGEHLVNTPLSSNKSMIGHTAAAHHQLRCTRPGDLPRRGAECGARCGRHHRAVQLVRLRRPERVAGAEVPVSGRHDVECAGRMCAADASLA
jgi:hypothetical protein